MMVRHLAASACPAGAGPEKKEFLRLQAARATPITTSAISPVCLKFILILVRTLQRETLAYCGMRIFPSDILRNWMNFTCPSANA
jgi:hypothetical protein